MKDVGKLLMSVCARQLDTTKHCNNFSQQFLVLGLNG